MADKSVLVIDDENLVAWSIQQELEEAKYRVFVAGTGEEGLRVAVEQDPDVILLDIMLPDRNGIEILKDIRKLGLSSMVIMLTALSDINHAVQSVREGAFDYISKPFDLEDVRHRIELAIHRKDLESEVIEYRSRQRRMGESFIAESEAMKRVVELVRVVATQSTSTVLLTGESGVGKDLVAA
ncbi:MAG: response regulator, partial [bacterium]